MTNDIAFGAGIMMHFCRFELECKIFFFLFLMRKISYKILSLETLRVALSKMEIARQDTASGQSKLS